MISNFIYINLYGPWKQNKKILRKPNLNTFFEKNNIDLNNYETLIMDTQGSELLVLKGAKNILKKIKYIKTEVSDFESYKGCCQLKDIDKFMEKNGFQAVLKSCFKRHEAGNYYDVLYEKNKFN